MREILEGSNINTRSRGGYPCEPPPGVNSTATLYRTAHIQMFAFDPFQEPEFHLQPWARLHICQKRRAALRGV